MSHALRYEEYQEPGGFTSGGGSGGFGSSHVTFVTSPSPGDVVRDFVRFSNEMSIRC